jgi:hypothetical protein
MPHNLLRKLPPGFAKLKALEALDLSHNRCLARGTDVAPIRNTDVGGALMEGMGDTDVRAVDDHDTRRISPAPLCGSDLTPLSAPALGCLSLRSLDGFLPCCHVSLEVVPKEGDDTLPKEELTRLDLSHNQIKEASWRLFESTKMQRLDLRCGGAGGGGGGDDAGDDDGGGGFDRRRVAGQL